MDGQFFCMRYWPSEILLTAARSPKFRPASGFKKRGRFSSRQTLPEGWKYAGPLPTYPRVTHAGGAFFSLPFFFAAPPHVCSHIQDNYNSYKGPEAQKVCKAVPKGVPYGTHSSRTSVGTRELQGRGFFAWFANFGIQSTRLDFEHDA